MKVWLLLLSLACVACAAPADPHKPVRGVFQMCAACQARRWPELRRFIRDAVQGGEYGQQLSLEYARADKPLLVVYGPFDQVVGRFNVADQTQEKLHELVQNFGFSRVPASLTSKVGSYNAFASDVADPTAGLNNGLGNGLNSAIYNAYGVYNAYSAYSAGAGTDPNSVLAGGYWPGAVAGVGAQAGLDLNAAGLGNPVGALNTGNLGPVIPGSAFNTLGVASNAAAGNWGTLGAATATGPAAAGGAAPSAGAGAAAAAGQAGGSWGSLGAAAPAASGAGAGGAAAGGGLGGFGGALGGGLSAFGAGGGLGSFGGGLAGGLGSAASMLGGGGGSLLGAPPAAVEEKPRPYPMGFGGFGRRRRQ